MQPHHPQQPEDAVSQSTPEATELRMPPYSRHTKLLHCSQYLFFFFKGLANMQFPTGIFFSSVAQTQQYTQVLFWQILHSYCQGKEYLEVTGTCYPTRCM